MFTAYRRYWDFQGRSSRSEYWLFFLWVFILGFIAGLVDRLALQSQGFIGPCTLFLTFAHLIPNLSLGFRRLHDTDRSAWWLLIGCIPLIGALVLFVFSVLAGTRGENRVGPAPGGRSYEDLQATFA